MFANTKQVNVICALSVISVPDLLHQQGGRAPIAAQELNPIGPFITGNPTLAQLNQASEMGTLVDNPPPNGIPVNKRVNPEQERIVNCRLRSWQQRQVPQSANHLAVHQQTREQLVCVNHLLNAMWCQTKTTRGCVQYVRTQTFSTRAQLIWENIGRAHILLLSLVSPQHLRQHSPPRCTARPRCTFYALCSLSNPGQSEPLRSR